MVLEFLVVDARVCRRPCTPGHLGLSVELALRADSTVGDRLRGVVICQVDTPPLDGADPFASALNANKIADERIYGLCWHCRPPMGVVGRKRGR